MKYLSLFSGIGGFELGIQQAYEDYLKCKHISSESQQKKRPQGRIGAASIADKMLCNTDRTAPLCIGYSEIDKYAIQVYEKHFKHKNYNDCTKIITSELPGFDLLVGGFPCQAFSIAGKRRGFDEARGTLFFDIARILADKKPRNFILENVKGLLSHDGGATFTTIIRILSTMGYFVEWQVLNAKSFGVPQNRERVFIVGHLGGQPRRKVFPIGSDDATYFQPKDRAESETKPASTISTHEGSRKENNYIIEDFYPDRVRTFKNESPTLRKGREGLKVLCGYSSSQRTDHVEERVKEGEANCLTTGKGCAGGLKSFSFVKEDMRIRRLTPKECERLMGYPDDWTAEGTQGKISDTQRYKMCGNGIVSNMVKEVVKGLLSSNTAVQGVQNHS